MISRGTDTPDPAPQASVEPVGGGSRHSVCLGCGGSRLVPLVEFTGIPTQSTIVLDSADQASVFERADSRISYCESCELISNTAFDDSILCYGDGFEESQFASQTFAAYAQSVAERLLKERPNAQAPITELGCGKAEFLELLCGPNSLSAFGIDPACDPERIDPALRDQILISQAFYGDEHREMVSASSFVCCRHTLEHLGDPMSFLTLLREHLEGHPETLVYFDLPDTDHVIDDGAFWEMNYEHCAYYTPSSLVGLFRRAGFGIREVGIEYGGQNLFIKATSGESTIDPNAIPRAGDPRERAELFATNTKRSIERWRAALGGQSGTALWGSGSRAVGFMGATELGDHEIDAVVDINPRRQGKFMPGYGRPIVAPQELIANAPERVIVMNPMYVREITETLSGLGLHPEVHAINAPPA